MSKPRVLLVNDASPLNSGYSTLGRNLMIGLYQSGLFELAELGLYIRPNDSSVLEFPWQIYGNLPEQGNEKQEQLYRSDPYNRFGKWKFNEVCLDFRPDTILSILDVWMVSFINQSPFRNYFKFLWLAAIDAEPQSKEFMDAYASVDGLLTYTDWAKDYLGKHGSNINLLGTAPPPINPAFQPTSNKKALREKFGLGEDLKIVGMTARNQKRKLFPNLFQAFRIYLNRTNSEDSYLYCHTSYPDNNGWNIPQLLHEYGLSNKVLFTYVCKDPQCNHVFPAFFSESTTRCFQCNQNSANMANVTVGISTEKLCEIYNLFDLYLHLVTNGAFEIPIAEAAACGIPVMGSYYSGPKDVLNKLEGEKILINLFHKELETERDMAVVDNNIVADKLVKFFNLSKEKQIAISQKCLENYKKNYRWEDSVKTWMQAILSLGKGNWTQPPNIQQPVPFEQIPPGLSDSEYIKYIILNVLCDSNKLGSFLETRLIRDLAHGISVGGLFGNYFNENSKMFERQFEPFDRKKAYKELYHMRTNCNEWENYRKQLFNL